MPMARMREHTTAARPENRNLFMPLATRALHESCVPATALSGRLPLPGLLGRIHGHGDVEIQRGADDAVLLDGVGGRVALARRGALRAADVAELQLGRQDLQQ